MPLYEYKCEACGGRFEVIRKFSDPPVETCRACGGSPVHRLISSPAIQFKGTGWYITDYSQKGKAPSGESTGADKADTGGTTEQKEGATPQKQGATPDKAAKSAASSDTGSSSSDGASKPTTTPAA
jgi:putative FmdB family regulatory protein